MTLKGPEKAAVILLCLQQDSSADIMQDLTEDEVHVLTQNLSTLGTIPPQVVESVIDEFINDMTGNAGVSGSMGAAERLLASFLPPEKVSTIMDDIRGPNSGRSTWEAFSGLNEQVIANYLAGEHDQMIAAVMTKLRPEVAARVLPLFGQERMTDVMTRMFKMDAIPAQVLDVIEDAVATEFLPSATRKSGPDLHQRMADLLNKMDSATFEDLSQELTQRAPKDFAAVKAKMFTFEDLAKLDKRSLQRLMRSCPDNALMVALRGAKKQLRDAFLDAMPTRARDQRKQDLEAMEPVRKREVRDAQDQIIDIANDLVRQDVIRKPTDDDQLV